MLKAIMYL